MTIAATSKPRQLESYVAGRWVRGAGKAATLLNAATGAPVARINSSGVDFAAALAYGRETVGPKLRKLSFHERAAMLKALGQKLMALKEEFYAESLPTGATRADGWIDIEGGIGTLLVLRLQGPPRAAEHPRPRRGRRRAAVEGRHLLRPAHPARRSKASPSTSTPSTSRSGGCWRRWRRRCIAGVPGHREAGEPDRLPDRAPGPPDRRERHPARGCHPAHRGLGRRPARPRHRPGRRDLHRLRLDRPQAAQPSGGRRATPSASRWRPTASTPRSSAPTPRRARRNSTSSSRRSPAR